MAINLDVLLTYWFVVVDLFTVSQAKLTEVAALCTATSIAIFFY
jgi:hypothetical protein